MTGPSPRSAGPEGPEVSVVVPTHERPRLLASCLDALARQTVASELEVVVVDDGTRDGEAVAEAVADRPGVKLIRQAGAGPAAARNAGVRHAGGTFICLTDDDCEPAPDWAERLVARLRAGADAVAGATINGRPGDPYAEATQTIHNTLATAMPASEEFLLFAPSNNVAARADVLASVSFDDTYRHAAGEDRDWCARLAARGYTLESEAGAVVVHRHELHARSFLRQHFRYGTAAYRYRRSASPSRGVERVFYARLIRQGFGRGTATGLLVVVAQVATAVGFALAALARRVSR